MTDLAVIVVTWNVRDLVLDALATLLADLEISGPQDSQVYVVDSASSDGTAQAVEAAFPQVELIKSEKNVGFAAANNLALKAMGFGSKTAGELPRAVYFLNPDTRSQPGAARTLFDALFAGTKIGQVGAALEYADGSFQHSAFMFPGLRQLWIELLPAPGRYYESAANGRYERALYQAGKPFSIDFPLGAAFMLRREVIQQTKGFDEQFFMYCEEIDWAWRIHKAGWTAQCVPAATVTHLAGQSTSQAQARSVLNLWQSRLLLFRKHYPLWKSGLARAIVALGMARKIARLESTASTADTQALVDAYRQIMRQALRGANQP